MAGTAMMVTGASTGIGEAVALQMERLGHRVFAGVRKAEDGDRLIAEAGGRLTPVLMDVTQPATVAGAAETVRRSLGGDRLVGLVNNAGITVLGPLEFLPPDSLRRQLEVNLIGHLAVTQAFLPLLRAGGGRVVNVGSMLGRAAIPFAAPYAISKFALEAMTASLRMELAPWEIPVVLVGPGSIATPLWDKSVSALDETLAAMSPAALALYGESVAAAREFQAAWAGNGIPVERVVPVVAHALTARRPRPRYVIGADAWQTELLRLLPTALRERLILWKMGLLKRKQGPEHVVGGEPG